MRWKGRRMIERLRGDEYEKNRVRNPFKSMRVEFQRVLTLTDSVNQIPVVDQIGQAFKKS